MLSQYRRPGRARLAVLAAAALFGAGAAGAAAPAWGPAADQPGTGPRVGIATADASPAVTEDPPRPVTVDETLVRSVARQILHEQDQPEHLTDLDLIARDVLALAPEAGTDVTGVAGIHEEAGTDGPDGEAGTDGVAQLEQVDELTRQVLLGHGPPGPVAHHAPAPPQCPPTAAACIDVDGKRAWLVDDGNVTYGPVPITTGKPGYETVRGSHPVLRQVRHDHSMIFDAPMPFSTYFTKSGIAFHEGGLDEPSHGCIHLGHHAAAHFFEHLQVGDEVVAF